MRNAVIGCCVVLYLGSNHSVQIVFGMNFVIAGFSVNCALGVFGGKYLRVVSQPICIINVLAFVCSKTGELVLKIFEKYSSHKQS